MELVSDKYYLRYSRAITALAFILFGGGLLSILSPNLFNISATGLSTFTVIVTGIHLVYYFLLHNRLYRANPLIASFVCCLLMALTVYNLMHITGGLKSPWHILWVLINILNGIFGTFIMVCSAFLTTFYFVMLSTWPDGSFKTDAESVLIVLGLYVSCYVGYFLSRKLYTDQESKQVNTLLGMVKTKQTESQTITQSIADGIIVVDTAGKITTINPAAARMAEWSVEEATTIDVGLVLKLLPEKSTVESENQSSRLFTEVLTTGNKVESSLELVGRSNKRHTVSLVISPVVPTGGNQIVGAVAVIRDISAARQEEARRADFISTASHEMRTPVAAIEGYLALALNDKVSQIDQKARAYLEKAHSSTQHLGKLFQDLLTSAKAEDGRLVNHPEVTEMGAYLEQIVDTLRFSAEKKGLLMDFTVGAGQTENTAGSARVIKPLYYVNVDPDRLREVITNLFDNAVKYTESGKISVALTGNEDVVQMYIRDTGPGISAADLPHLFQKFYRVDNSSTRTIGGTGLGLFICRKIIELYNGRIWAESTVDKGSTFYINLPRLSSQKATDLQAKQAAEKPIYTTP